MSIETPERPNPGSREALDQGCLCPVMDNNHGKQPPFDDPDGWYIHAECPVHAGGYPW